ncbi:MAG: hypothetical protein U0X20_05195 [Caldilineaceae bacterium]
MPTDPLAWIDDELQQLAAGGLRTNIRTIESPMDAWVTIGGRRLLNFCANNYLGLANHPRLHQAAKDAVDQYGVGPGAVRTIAGTTSLHRARGAPGSVQTCRSLHHPTERLYGQSSYHSCPCWP